MAKTAQEMMDAATTAVHEATKGFFKMEKLDADALEEFKSTVAEVLSRKIPDRSSFLDIKTSVDPDNPWCVKATITGPDDYMRMVFPEEMARQNPIIMTFSLKYPEGSLAARDAIFKTVMKQVGFRFLDTHEIVTITDRSGEGVLGSVKELHTSGWAYQFAHEGWIAGYGDKDAAVEALARNYSSLLYGMSEHELVDELELVRVYPEFNPSHRAVVMDESDIVDSWDGVRIDKTFIGFVWNLGGDRGLWHSKVLSGAGNAEQNFGSFPTEDMAVYFVLCHWLENRG